MQAQMSRAGREINQDGSFELGWGAALLCFGMSSYLIPELPKSIWGSWWTFWIGYLPGLCAAFSPYAIPKLVKRYFTWPRTGYVANPHEVKFLYLVKLMIFGGALGIVLAMPAILVSQIRGDGSHTVANGDPYHIILNSTKLLICLGLVIYLGPKVITRRRPVPTAYDGTVILRKIQETPAGRMQLRIIRYGIFAVFAGIPLLACGIVFAWIYLTKAVMHQAELEWSEWGYIGFLTVANALLYLMIAAASFRRHSWKLLVLLALLIGPMVVAVKLPGPVAAPGTLFEHFPPVGIFMGLAWFLSGAVTLIWFIMHHPLPETERP